MITLGYPRKGGPRPVWTIGTLNRIILTRIAKQGRSMTRMDQRNHQSIEQERVNYEKYMEPRMKINIPQETVETTGQDSQAGSLVVKILKWCFMELVTNLLYDK